MHLWAKMVERFDGALNPRNGLVTMMVEMMGLEPTTS